MKAMIFAAGFGTRLRPLTLTTPKPLVKIAGQPILGWILDYLSGHGVDEAIINTHYLSEQLEAFAASYDGKIQLSSILEKPEILGTGGGLFNAKDFFSGGSESFLLCTSDILTDLNVVSFADFHNQKGHTVTLALNKVQSRGMLLFDEEMNLAGRINHDTGVKTLVAGAKGRFSEWGFSGFHMLHPHYFGLVEGKPEFDIIAQYLELASQGHKIQGFNASDAWFADIGSPAQLRAAQDEITKQKG
ncbi:MAG: sugar phosphate nucleotidyltransferase [SAR324 cluster bacterium]|nr:sugar phosphate nucleotidyltransferase [SAR324 cluster bacterium]